MYFYVISGYISERSLSITTVTDEENNRVETYTPVITRVPIRQKISYEEMLEAYDDETDCYISYDDEDPPRENESVTHPSAEGALITAALLEDLEELFGSESGLSETGSGGESVVGSGSGSGSSGSQPVQTGSLYEFTTYTLTIDSVSAGASYTDTVTPTKSGYELAGISGYSVNNTSGLIPFRVRADDGDLLIGIRNITSDAITNKTMDIDLLWHRAAAEEEEELEETEGAGE